MLRGAEATLTTEKIEKAATDGRFNGGSFCNYEKPTERRFLSAALPSYAATYLETSLLTYSPSYIFLALNQRQLMLARM